MRPVFIVVAFAAASAAASAQNPTAPVTAAGYTQNFHTLR